ncbi:hypothetical protein AVEN_183630-1, partial [Araneus ventricosus]
MAIVTILREKRLGLRRNVQNRKKRLRTALTSFMLSKLENPRFLLIQQLYEAPEAKG